MTHASARPAGRRGVLVCGEALIDLLPDSADASAPPGARPFVAYPSGSPCNTAVALARLGVPAQLAARLSHDAFGRMLRDHLRANGVDLTHAVDADEQTTLAVVGIGEHGDAEYSFYVRGTADWQWSPDELPDRPDPSIAVVHVGSLALALPPGGAVLEEFMARVGEHCLVSLDPNVRPDLISDMDRYAVDLDRWVGMADIVKVSEADLHAVYPGQPPQDTVARWASGRLVVLTRGGDGATVFFGGACIDVPGFPVEVVDTVAAGDTFAAGLLDGLLRAGLTTSLAEVTLSDVVAAAEHGCAAAAVTCGRAGPNPPHAVDLPSR